MNFIQGALEVEAGNFVFRAKNLEQSLPPGTHLENGGRVVTLGVRSEHVVIGKGSKQGRVTLTEPMGDETLVFFDYGGEAALVAKVNPEMTLASGDAIEFEFDIVGFHLFDGETGDRLT